MQSTRTRTSLAPTQPLTTIIGRDHSPKKTQLSFPRGNQREPPWAKWRIRAFTQADARVDSDPPSLVRLLFVGRRFTRVANIRDALEPLCLARKPSHARQHAG